MARAMLFQCLCRAEPNVADGFFAIMAYALVLWCCSHKEPGIEAPGRAGWGNPVAQVGHPVQRDRQLVLLAKFSQRELASEHGLAIIMSGVISADCPPVGIDGQQHAGFFEAFADGGQHIICATVAQAHGVADFSVFRTSCMHTPMGFLLIYRAARENVIAGQKHRVPGTL